MKKLLAKLQSWDTLMILLLISQCIYYGYQNIIPLEPQSLHIWRQSDCASYTWGYASQTLNFFQPEMNNLAPNGTGQVATEFPILYYISGILYRVFGIVPAIPRMLNITFVLMGLFSLYRILKELFTQKFWPIILPMFLFTSPLLVFFTNNFLPDLPAFGLSIWATYYFYLYASKGYERKHYILSLSLFLLAALLKLSFVLPLLVLLCFYLIEQIPVLRRNLLESPQQLFSLKRIQHILSFTGVFLLLSSWYIYASWYSTRTAIDHFSSITSPAYGMSFQEILTQINYITSNLNLEFYYLESTQIFLGVLSVGLLLGLGKSSSFNRLVFILLLLGGLVYLSFFLKILLLHEYYFAPLYLCGIPVLLYGARLFDRYISKHRPRQIGQFLFILFLLINIYHAKSQMQIRYYGRGMNYRENLTFYTDEFREYLLEKGVNMESKVISYPDPSMNNTLYLMRRKGWSSLGIERMDADFVTQLKYEGAEYMILSDTLYRQDSLLMPALTNQIGSMGGIDIYDLSELKR